MWKEFRKSWESWREKVDEALGGAVEPIKSSNVSFNNADTDLTATNVQSALEEVNDKIHGYAAPNASQVDYDNTESGMSATNVQAAIDELASGSINIEAQDVSYDGSNSGLAATDVQGAIDEVVTDLGDKVDKVAGKELSTNDYTDADAAIVAGVTTALAGKVDKTSVGVANGVAELGSDGKVPSSQLPAGVDSIVEGYLYNGKFYEEATHETEITPASNIIYIDLTTEKTYRWGSTVYVEISQSLALGETSSTAYRGDRGKTAYDFSQTPYASTPAEDGTASAGSSSAWARGDHVHPHDSTKVDKENGKGLSANDFTNTLKSKLEGIAAGAEVNVQANWNQTDTTADDYIKNKPSNATTSTAGLMSAEDKTKLNGIATGAEVNVQANWSQTNTSADDYIKNKPSNATTSTAGLMSATDKTKLDGIATGAEVNVQANWTQSDSTKDDFIKNKPTVDASPTSDSNNLVKSGGVYTALGKKITKIDVPNHTKQLTITIPTDGTTVEICLSQFQAVADNNAGAARLVGNATTNRSDNELGSLTYSKSGTNLVIDCTTNIRGFLLCSSDDVSVVTSDTSTPQANVLPLSHLVTATTSANGIMSAADKRVVNEVGSKYLLKSEDDLTVTADGTKTVNTLLSEIYALFDAKKSSLADDEYIEVVTLYARSLPHYISIPSAGMYAKAASLATLGGSGVRYSNDSMQIRSIYIKAAAANCYFRYTNISGNDGSITVGDLGTQAESNGTKYWLRCRVWKKLS